MTSTADISQVKELLHQWLVRQMPEERLDWIENKIKQVTETDSDKLLFTTFSSIPRYTGKADLDLTTTDLQNIELARSGWMPAKWSLDQVGRTLLLVSLPADNSRQYSVTIEKLFGAADVSEQIALYQSLPLLPYPQQFINRAAEGLRTSIDAVFNAIALRNPYPGDYFQTATWNQMILKAVFVGSPLHLIQQLDQRANATLARMLSDYIHERWAAKRQVTPEIWRLIGPFLNEHLLSDIHQALNMPDRQQKLAAALACSHSLLPAAQTLLQKYPNVHNEIASLDWQRFSQMLLVK